MASFNKERFISETVRSVTGQSYGNWELLIVDDYSTDTTTSILDDLPKDERIRIFKNQVNKGANFCRNFGLEQARGEYIVFIDGDDLLAPACIENRVLHAVKEPDLNLLVFTMGVFHRSIGDDKRAWIPSSPEPLKDFLQHKLPWSILQPFWKKSFLMQLGGFDERFTRLQDVELNTRALFHPEIAFKQIAGKEDCYYRIDETRKNYKAFEMMSRYVQSAVDYCTKFREPAGKRFGSASLLAGTLYKIYLMLVHNYKTGALSKTEKKLLEKKLLAPGNNLRLGFFKRFAFKASGLYNQLPFRIPGINWVISKLIIV